jgi:hypothetical protein
MRRNGAGHGADRAIDPNHVTAGTMRMTMRTRKLVGTVVLLVFLAVYALLTMLVAVVLQVNSSKIVELLFYVVGGLAWVVPAALLVRWMQKPDPPQPT